MKNKKKEIKRKRKRKFKHPNDIEKSPKITRIYLVDNCYNDPNKVYIGKEKSHRTSSRKTDHQKTYGEKIIFSYIDECEGWEVECFKLLEGFWIEQFRQWGFEVLNKQMNGGGGVSFQTEESKKLMSISSMRQYGKPIIQYSLVGDFIKEWDYIEDVKDELKIYPQLKSKNKICSSGGFQWKYKEGNKYPLKIKPILRKIIQYSLDGNFIKVWNNAKEIVDTLGITGIHNCLNGKVKSSKGFQWNFLTEECYPKNISPYKMTKNYNIKINQFSLDGKLIKTWNSQAEILDFLGIGSISNCLNNREKTAYGYIWKYKDKNRR